MARLRFWLAVPRCQARPSSSSSRICHPVPCSFVSKWKVMLGTHTPQLQRMVDSDWAPQQPDLQWPYTFVELCAGSAFMGQGFEAAGFLPGPCHRQSVMSSGSTKSMSFAATWPHPIWGVLSSATSRASDPSSSQGAHASRGPNSGTATNMRTRELDHYMPSSGSRSNYKPPAPSWKTSHSAGTIPTRSTSWTKTAKHKDGPGTSSINDCKTTGPS